MHEQRSHSVIEEGVLGRPDVPRVTVGRIDRNVMRLIRWLGVRARGRRVIPDPTLVGYKSVEVAMSPIKDLLALGKQGCMHRRDLWESGDCFPLATVERVTALVIDGRTIIRAVVQGQPCRRRQLSRLLGREPYGLTRAYEADQTRHHVHLDMTVEGEVSFEVIGLGPTRPVLRVLSLFYCVGQQQDLGRSRLDNERLGRTDASDINRLACEVPPLGMWVKVVPHHAKVEVEDVPEDFLAWVGNDCRSVADERAAVEAV